ncbi:MAG TPA: hypothetical protein VFM32_09945 [Spongiibacteraceae bacterium]|nr:hypothetical protein [Spongiibacteraceae bacterium]
MKKLLLACSLIGAMSAVHAQPAQSPMPNPSMGNHNAMHAHAFDPAEHAAHLQKTLQLSDEQTAKVKKLFEDEEQQRKSVQDKYKPQFEAFRADMTKLREQTHTQLSGILTPKQQQALEAQRKTFGWDICPTDKDGRPHEHGHERN